MASSNLGVLFVMTLVSLGQSSGYDVILRLTTSSQGQGPFLTQGGCHLPDDLDVEVSSPGTPLPEELTPLPRNIPLSRHDARHTASHVYVIQTDPTGRYYLDTVQLDNPQNEELERYYNHEIGVSITVRCSRKEWSVARYSVEGSMFIKGVKYLLKPSNSLRFERFRDSLTSLIQLIRIDEHNAEDSAWKQVSPSDVQQHAPRTNDEDGVSIRTKRETTVYHIDVLPVVDYSMYARWKTNKPDINVTLDITTYIENILTSVNMRLDTLSLEGRNLKVHLISPIFSTNATTSPWNANILEVDGSDTKTNATKLLTAFKNWLSSNSRSIPKYDHAFLMTAYDIYGGNDQGIRYNVTKGLAYVGTVCSTNGESSSIIEDKGGYQSEGVLAHELGHSLGSLHDGSNNNCPSTDRFLMADTNHPTNSGNFLNPWKFSNCSSASILMKLKALENSTYLTCLTTRNGTDVNLTSPKHAIDQCKSIFGSESFVCRGTAFGTVSTFCSMDFYCRTLKSDTCEKITTATGTCCGNQKKCIQGNCTAASTGECSMDDECPLDDQPGVIIDGQSCSTMNSSYCYLPDVRIKCCKACRGVKSTNTNCEYGDKRTGCQSKYCGGTDTNGNYYNFFCCNTCATVSYQESILTTDDGKQVNCSEYVSIYTASVCNKPVIHGNYCSITCELNRDKDNIDCPWGDRNNCSKLRDTAYSGYICDAGQKFNCCRTCANFTTTSTSTTITSTSTSSSTKTSTKLAPTTTTTTTTTTTKTTTTQKPTVKVCSPSPCAACSTFNFVTSLVLLVVCVYLTYVTK